MSQYIGTISTSCGTISVPRKSRNSRSRPRNLSRANAYADEARYGNDHGSPDDRDQEAVEEVCAERRELERLDVVVPPQLRADERRGDGEHLVRAA